MDNDLVMEFPIKTKDCHAQINRVKEKKGAHVRKIDSILRGTRPDYREYYLAGFEDAKRLCELNDFLDKFGNWPESQERMFGSKKSERKEHK